MPEEGARRTGPCRSPALLFSFGSCTPVQYNEEDASFGAFTVHPHYRIGGAGSSGVRVLEVASGGVSPLIPAESGG